MRFSYGRGRCRRQRFRAGGSWKAAPASGHRCNLRSREGFRPDGSANLRGVAASIRRQALRGCRTSEKHLKRPQHSVQSARSALVPQMRTGAGGIAYSVRALPRLCADVVLGCSAASAHCVFRRGRKTQQHGGVAQLVRAHGSYPCCHWFESSHRYQVQSSPHGRRPYNVSTKRFRTCGGGSDSPIRRMSNG